MSVGGSERLSCDFCVNQIMHLYFSATDGEKYYQCSSCDFIKKDPALYLKFLDERKRYDLHKNDFQDQAYLNFLSPLVEAMKRELVGEKNQLIGLDFGCGKAAPFYHLFSGWGIAMERYDLHYFPEIPSKKYDFILASEVIEHFQNPRGDFVRINSLLKPGGILGLMSSWWNQSIDFKSWYYRKDPTHVCFYSRKSLTQIASTFNYQIQSFGDNTCVLKKSCEKAT